MILNIVCHQMIFDLTSNNLERRNLLVFDFGRLVGILPLNVFVEGFDFFDIRFNIASGIESWAKATNFTAEIKKAKSDGNMGPIGDMIKTGFPSGYFRSGSLRRDDDNEPIMFPEGINGVLNHVIALFPVNGQSAKPSHNRPCGSLEKTVFAHPENFKPHDESHGDH